MSELDSLSDSDWLDIASGHGSEDNDSISSHESDRDINSRPHSRRSSISLGSSRDGDIEAWEGFAYDSGDEMAPIASGMYPTPLSNMGSADSQRMPLDLIPDIETEQDRAEDERVKEALDQSLIGTLSASRTSTSSAQNASAQASVPSIRDLRLSFPDPLNSSRDELNRSYEDVSPSEGTLAHPDTAELEAGGTSPDLSLDPGLPSSPTVRSQEGDECHAESSGKPDFEIYLYGSSTEQKWEFVQDLLQKYADGSGQFLSRPLDSGNGLVQTVVLENDDEDCKSLINIVRVYDRTEDNIVELFDTTDSPSLGIVFLPAMRLPVLSTHSAYLPVLTKHDPSDVIYDTISSLRAAGEDDWELLTVPSVKVLPLGDAAKSYLITQEAVRVADPLEVHRAMSKTVVLSSLKNTPKPPAEQSNTRNAVTIFAIVSLIMGFALHTSFHSAPTPTKTVNLTVPNSTHWLSASPGPNRSNNFPIQYTNGKPQLVSSAKDMALSVYNPGSTSLSLTNQEKSLSPISPISPTSVHKTDPSASLECSRCMTGVLSDTGTTKEVSVVLAASSSLSTQPTETQTISSVDVEEDEEDLDELDEAEATTALGFKFIDSLSEVLGVTTKSVAKAVGSDDSSELFDGLDDLMASIRTQTDDLIKQSKGKARAFGDQVQETLNYRNDRARTRAKELRKRGEEFINSATANFIERTDVARKRAQRIRESLRQSEAWQYYQEVHGDWDDSYHDHSERNWYSHRGGGCVRARNRRRSDGRYATAASVSCG
ncbi:hypothetical protein FA15DRAFT_585009 [Coprinopsis marcescibilis]|uniref:Uncharacterized protein n=1 Tax=Coprinopsis marcescibilis TaxID=230819 RepID=A0A5C3L4Z4_COPMA|nr:hypothetical protein FA15DRAFT_585009 [Coprinopsis marcescibilis]